ncbi:MAG TPA: M1 family aminopeptidase, partial [Thermoanaerobaculia bacterium]
SANALTISGTFTRLYVTARGVALPTFGAPATGALAESLEQHRAFFDRDQTPPASHLFTTAAVDAPRATVAFAEIDGGKDRFVFTYDSLEDRSETLDALVPAQGVGDREFRRMLFRVSLSKQPINRSVKEPVPPRFMLVDLDFTLTASDAKDASLVVTETIVPQGAGQRSFRFGLWKTIYFEDGKSPRQMMVKSVVDAAGRAIPFDHDRDQILVVLPEPAPAGKPFKLTFRIDGDFLIRPGGDNYWELGIGAWYPEPPLSAQAFSLHAVVKVKGPFIPLVPGKTIRREKEGEYNVVETRVEQPIMSPAILAGKFSFEEQTRNGVTIRVATYAMKNTRAMKQLAELAFGMIQYYEYFLGPFPFPEFNIIQVNSYGWGQAPPGTMFITNEAFQPTLGFENQYFSEGINERFAHEIAHQYWGYVVKMPSYEEQWLDEAFAEYSAALVLKKFQGQAVYDRMVNRWRANAQIARKVAPIPYANRISWTRDGHAAFMHRIYLIYDKGAYLLATLHKELGDETFLTFMKSYQKSFRWKHGSTKHVAGLLQFMTKKDYSEFFDKNFWGTEMPASK